MQGYLESSREPRYVQLTKTLLEKIAQGHYPVGELLPKEAQLCETYGVSRTTVREALRIMSEQGVVDKLHGIGTVVKSTELRRNFVVSVNSADSMQYGMQTQVRLVDRTTVSAQGPLKSLLGDEQGNTWFRIRAVRWPVEDPSHPIAFMEVYIPEKYADVAQQEVLSDLPFHQRIAKKYRIPVVDIEQEIMAVTMSGEVAEYLNSPKGQVALLVNRRILGPGGELIQASVNTHPSDRFSYRFYMNQIQY